MSARLQNSSEHKGGYMVAFSYCNSYLEAKLYVLAFSLSLILKQLLIYEGKWITILIVGMYKILSKNKIKITITYPILSF